MAVALATLTAADAMADDRSVPIGNICAGLRFYSLEKTSEVGDGWLRAIIAGGPFVRPGEIVPEPVSRLVWDVRCADGRLAEAGRVANRTAADDLAENAPIGTGEWPNVHCAPDQTFPGVAEMICAHHAKTEQTK